MTEITLKNYSIFWIGVFALFLAFLYVFQPVLMPFVLGLALAYLLNPLVTKLEKMGAPRGISALTMIALFFVFLGVVLAVALPLLAREAAQISKDLPAYMDQIMVWAQPYITEAQSWIGQQEVGDIREILSRHGGNALNAGNAVLGGLAASGQAIGSFAGNFLMLAIVSPVVAYFMIKEWPAIMTWGKELLPRDHKSTIENLLSEINLKISGFVRGQITVAFVLAVGYALALSLLGLKYGVLIGFSAGLLSIIPMFGAVFGFILSGLVAWFQMGEWAFVAQVLGVFIAGQIIEGNFLTPKLVGESVGLHPLWVFFALLAGGSLFGVLGMFLAVPVAAVAGVLIAFGIATYKASEIYKGKKKAGKKTSARSSKKKVK